MSSQKLFVFVADNAPISAIIRKEKIGGRPCYQIIKWNMETNEFTEGQWLMNKQLFIRGCAISPNGQLFGWQYNRYWKLGINEPDPHAGISTLPNFTAELYGTGGCGRWNNIIFDKQSRPLPLYFKFEKKGTMDIELSNILPGGSNKNCASNGLKPINFQTNDGKNIRVDGYKLIVDDNVIYNAENNVFVNREKIV